MAQSRHKQPTVKPANFPTSYTRHSVLYNQFWQSRKTQGP